MRLAQGSMPAGLADAQFARFCAQLTYCPRTHFRGSKQHFRARVIFIEIDGKPTQLLLRLGNHDIGIDVRKCGHEVGIKQVSASWQMLQPLEVIACHQRLFPPSCGNSFAQSERWA